MSFDTDLTPLWFLDVDGVLNCYPTPRRTDIDMHGPFDYNVIINKLGSSLTETLDIWTRKPVVDFINSVNRDGLARVMWLTSWKDKAPGILAPLVGLDDFPVLPSPTKSENPGSPYWWKKTAVESAMDGFDGKMVWTDDDIPPVLGRTMRDRYGDRALIIAPDEQPGLANKHLRSIKAHLTC